jgi:hypothetical protein
MVNILINFMGYKIEFEVEHEEKIESIKSRLECVLDASSYQMIFLRNGEYITETVFNEKWADDLFVINMNELKEVDNYHCHFCDKENSDFYCSKKDVIYCEEHFNNHKCNGNCREGRISKYDIYCKHHSKKHVLYCEICNLIYCDDCSKCKHMLVSLDFQRKKMKVHLIF